MTIETILARLVHTDEGCWEWPPAVKWGSYGSARLDGRSRGVHVLVYEHLRGPIPDGLQLDHTCTNLSCANPDHLEPVTAQENSIRSIQRRSEGIPKRHGPVKVYLTGKQARWIAAEKKRTGFSAADIVRRAIDYYLTAPTSVRGGDEGE